MEQLQKLAEFLRNAAYADGQSHHIGWSLHVVHPKTNEGDIGFGGGLFTRDHCKPLKHFISLSFSYSESKGIYRVKAWKDESTIYDNEKAIPFDGFQAMVVKLFGIEDLYNPAQ